MADARKANSVTSFYDNHPINEQQIIEKLSANNIDLNSLTEDILQDYDQDHYGGIAANGALAKLAGINNQSKVLDVCCGVGGRARYLANNYGCQVIGIDITQSRIESARRLTKMVGMDTIVSFECADALHLPFEDNIFDVVISQEAFCHIPRKSQLIHECVRVLKPGGKVTFTDVLVTKKITKTVRQKLQSEMAFFELQSRDKYQAILSEAGCETVKVTDLGDEWRTVLIDRLAMYRSLKDQTVKRFGDAHYEKWDSAYNFFVGLYKSGELSGGRFLGIRKP